MNLLWEVGEAARTGVPKLLRLTRMISNDQVIEDSRMFPEFSGMFKNVVECSRML